MQNLRLAGPSRCVRTTLNKRIFPVLIVIHNIIGLSINVFGFSKTDAAMNLLTYAVEFRKIIEYIKL